MAINDVISCFHRVVGVLQVHEAWLNNVKYAVKVQRPGLAEMFSVDLGCLRILAKLADRSVLYTSSSI